MEVIPAIDIRGGRCVRLVQGDYGRETVFAEDPAEVARRWVTAGAGRLHVVDLDGARDGGSPNRQAIERLMAAAALPVQIGGGIRSLAAIEGWLTAGADRVILGTAVVEEPSLAAEAARRYGERVAVSVDVSEGRVAVRGWRETSDESGEAFLRRMWESGIRHLLYTDIARDGTLAHPDLAALTRLLERLPELRDATGTAALTLAGGMASVDDVRALLPLGLEGVILGRSLYEGRIDLAEALAAATGA